jgi:anti-anti-sigma factor
VEAPAAGIVVVRVGGELDRATAPRLARLLDNQIASFPPAPRDPGRSIHLVIDVAHVRCFGVGGLEVLRHARHTCELAEVQLHLAGLSSREAMLPLRVAEFLPLFSTFPTLEHALHALAQLAL